MDNPVQAPKKECGVLSLHSGCGRIEQYFRLLTLNMSLFLTARDPEGCPAHQSVKAAIRITWDATLHIGEEVIRLSNEALLENGGR